MLTQLGGRDRAARLGCYIGHQSFPAFALANDGDGLSHAAVLSEYRFNFAEFNAESA